MYIRELDFLCSQPSIPPIYQLIFGCVSPDITKEKVFGKFSVLAYSFMGAYTAYMDTVLKADIFFVVTTIAVFVVAAILIWALAYVIKILHNVEDISETVKKETTKFSHDLDGFRDQVQKKGMVPSLIRRWFGRSAHKNKHRAEHHTLKN